MTGLIDEVERQRHKVVVDNYTPTWNELLDQFRNRDLKVDPDYQRAFRWSIDQQTKYIESLLLNIPTPPIFLAEKKDGKFEVIDGLQRFSTMVKFFAAELFRESKGPAQTPPSNNGDSDNDIRTPTILSEPPILRGLSGLSKETLPETLVRTLRYARIQVILLKKESSELARFNVFARLNRAGTVLSNQEIRNCSARLFDNGFADKLMRIGRSSIVANALNLSSKESGAMGAQENVLRLIAFCHFSPTSQRIEEFLDTSMYKAASGEFDFSEKIEARVMSTFQVIFEAYPDGQAFRFFKDGKFKGGFSSNLFDIVACGIYKNAAKSKSRPTTEIKELIRKLHSEKSAMALTGAGSNTKAKMIGRVEFGKKWFR